MSEETRIEKLIASARRRVRLQYVIDGGTLGLAAGLFLATLVLGLMKGGVLPESSATLWYSLCALGPIGGIAWAFWRKIDDVGVAAMIDRANAFDDRLASAWQFLQERDRDNEFKRAQIEDTVKRLDDVDPSKAHQFTPPRDLAAVAIFAAALLLMVLVQFPDATKKERGLPTPVPQDVEEEQTEVVTNLPEGLATFRKDQVEDLIREAEKAENEEARETAEELRDLLEKDQRGELTPEEFNEKLDEITKKMQSNCETVDKAALFSALEPLSPAFSDEEKTQKLVSLIDSGEFDAAIEEVDNLATEIAGEAAWTDGLDQDTFYARVDDAIETHLQCTSKELAEVEKELKEAAAAALDSSEQTKELAEAIKAGDMEKAAQELEKLAEKAANDELSKEEVEKLAKLLEKFADHLDLDDPELQKQIEKYRKWVDKLERKMKKQGKKLSAREKKQLDRARRKLAQLQRKMDKKNRGESGRRLKRLTAQSRKAAEELRRQKQRKLDRQKGKKGQQSDHGEKRHNENADRTEKGKKKDGESGEQEEEPEMRAAEEMRRLNRDQQGEKTKEELKEASDRLREDAKRSQGGRKKKDGSGKKKAGDQRQENKIDEYLRRAKGKGKKPGQKGKQGEQGKQGKQGQGQGQQASGGKGSKPGSSGDKKSGQEKGGQEAGDGHEDADGPRTADLDSQRQDTKVKGQKGEGPGTAETIKKASQKGFASRQYKEVYENYEKAVEDVLEQEKVPPGYRHYVRTYFDFIRPQDGE